MENNTIEGEVKFVKHDKKGLTFDGQKWYSNQFLKEPLNCEKGDKVKLTLNQKGFLEKCEILQKSVLFKTADRIDNQRAIDENARLRRELDARTDALKIALSYGHDNLPIRLKTAEVLKNYLINGKIATEEELIKLFEKKEEIKEEKVIVPK